MIEFSRPQRLDTIGTSEQTVEIAADADERAALAARFALIGIERLSARCTVRREAAGIRVDGVLDARVTQACSVTGEPLPASIAEDFAIRFLPEGDEPAGDEVELDGSDLDTMFYEGGAIDLGEAAAETLALSLAPYPRGPNAAAALRAAGVITEEDAKPAGALAGLKDLLKGG